MTPDERDARLMQPFLETSRWVERLEIPFLVTLVNARPVAMRPAAIRAFLRVAMVRSSGLSQHCWLRLPSLFASLDYSEAEIARSIAYAAQPGGQQRLLGGALLVAFAGGDPGPAAMELLARLTDATLATD